MPNPPKDGHYHWGTGRRKTSVARVRLIPDGTGKVEINGKPLNVYFTTDATRQDCVSPLRECDLANKVDVKVSVNGGGTTGQSQAVRMGLARALLKYDEGFKQTLRTRGYLTRDAREVERKKYGHPKARKSFQFSKR